jgi:WD40 repeat protein
LYYFDIFCRIFDAARKKEVGSLMEHRDMVNALDFFQNTHLLTGSADGIIIVWKVSSSHSWNALAVLKGHK